MNRKNQHFGRLAGAVLAVSLAACGSVQGTSTARAGTPADNSVNAVHLTDFDQDTAKAAAIEAALQQAIALDQKNEQQRLAQQGNSARPAVTSTGGVSATGGPALVP